jgi:hypothetical protein
MLPRINPFFLEFCLNSSIEKIIEPNIKGRKNKGIKPPIITNRRNIDNKIDIMRKTMPIVPHIIPLETFLSLSNWDRSN